jgi:ABC-2 type transport system permease protein
MNQIISGIKKEALFFWRKFILGGILITFLGCATFYPLSSVMMNSFAEAFEEMFMEETETNEAVEIFSETFSEMSDPYYLSLISFLGVAMIITMILLNGTAGREQKRREIIMPQITGLNPSGYIIPKFLFYPVAVFIITLGSCFFTNAFCNMLFKEAMSFETVLITGTITGVSLMFYISFYLFLGLSTAQPGLSVIYVLVANELFGFLTGLMGVDKYTPWSLNGMIWDILYTESAEYTNIFITLGITLLLCVVFMLAALFVMTAKKVDNTADEVY